MPARFQIAWSVDCVRCSNVARRRERQKNQHVADTILAALGQAVDLPAAGEGPMNNVIIDGLDWTYYETVGGGKGASSAGSGASGMHLLCEEPNRTLCEPPSHRSNSGTSGASRLAGYLTGHRGSTAQALRPLS